MGQNFLAKVAWWSLQKEAESCSNPQKDHSTSEKGLIFYVVANTSPWRLLTAVGSWERGHIQEALFSAFCLVLKFSQLRENFTVHLVQPWTLLGEKVLSKFEAFIFSPFWNIGWIIRNPPPEVIGFTNISWVFALFCVLLVLGLWRDDPLLLSGWERR